MSHARAARLSVVLAKATTLLFCLLLGVFLLGATKLGGGGTASVDPLSCDGTNCSMSSGVLQLPTPAASVANIRNSTGTTGLRFPSGRVQFVTGSVTTIDYPGTAGLTAASGAAFAFSSNANDASSGTRDTLLARHAAGVLAVQGTSSGPGRMLANFGFTTDMHIASLGSGSGTVDLDFSSVSARKSVTLSGNPTLTFSNAAAHTAYLVKLTQDGTGGRTVTWPGSVTWLGGTPVLSTTASQSDFFSFYYDGGTFWGTAATQTGSLLADDGTNVTLSSGQFLFGTDIGLARHTNGQVRVTNGGVGNGSLHVGGTLHTGTALVLGTHVVVVASNGTAVENAEVIAPKPLLLVDCLDAHGCTLHLGTTSVVPGTLVRLVSISANGSLLVPSVTNVQHVASAFTMGANDAITLVSVRNRSGAQYWIELGRSNN